MQMNQLVSAASLAQRFGVKSIGFGPPGGGKTPISTTAPRPVMCVIEPGMLSMRHAVNTPCWQADTPAKIDEFFDWIKTPEIRNFDTIIIDSVSQMAESFLSKELGKTTSGGNSAHGKKAYGDMARHTMDLLSFLYYMPQKHIYLIAKQGNVEEGGVMKLKPYFPGQDLNVRVPHMFDLVMHIAKAQPPGCIQPVTCMRTIESYNIFARDRSGKCDEFEPPNLTTIFQKCMS